VLSNLWSTIVHRSENTLVRGGVVLSNLWSTIVHKKEREREREEFIDNQQREVNFAAQLYQRKESLEATTDTV
jgi:hypothetical protein